MGEFVGEHVLENLRQRRRNMKRASVRPVELDQVFSPGPDTFYFKPELKPPAASIHPNLDFLLKEEDEFHF